MNLINKILILLIIIFLINYLTKGKIIDTIKRYISVCMNLINIDTPKKCSVEECSAEIVPNVLKKEPITLQKFIKNIIKPIDNNLYQLTKNYKMKKKAPEQFIKYIDTFLNKTLNEDLLNKGALEFTNIKIIDDIYYIDITNGKEIIPFNFRADVNNNPTVFNIEVFFSKGRLSIIDMSYMKEQSKETFEDIFIKLPDNVKLEDFEDLNDSMIPSIVNITSYEMTSENNTSN